MRLEQLIQPKAGDRLSFEFGEELEIETPILYAEDDNIVVGADDKTFDLFNRKSLVFTRMTRVLDFNTN